MATRERTVVVLGGAGSVGAETVRQLSQRDKFGKIIVADRNVEGAQQLAQELGAEAAEIDVTDKAALLDLIRGVNVVLNTAGPFFLNGTEVIRCAIEARVPYADVNDEEEPILELFSTDDMDRAARDAGIPLVVGLGTSPGLTNILTRYGAQEFDTVESVQIALATGPWTRGFAVWSHHLHAHGGQTTIYRNGDWTQVPAMSEEETITFPWAPGQGQVHIVSHPEPLTLPRFFPGIQEVVFKLGHPPNVNQLYRDLSKYGLTSEASISYGTNELSPADFVATYLSTDQADEVFGFSKLTPYSMREVRIAGERNGRPLKLRYQISMKGGPIESGLPLAITAELLADDEISAGLYSPEGLDPEPFLRAFPELGARSWLIREEEPSALV